LSQRARVLVAYGNSGVVELPDGARRECKFRRSIGRPYCGDRVTVEDADGESTVVTEIQPRDNVFMRAGTQGRKQVIAANLDQVLVVLAPAPEPSRDLVERYLVAVHSLGIRPLLVLNKAERMEETNPGQEGPLRRLDEYRDLGYALLRTSCKGPPGVDALPPALKSRTSILVGQSGVGKSSLVNALLPDLELQTGALSRVTGKGTHTTTTTIMYTLPCGGRLIDSPGVWEYGLWEMSQDEIANGFIEFRAFEGQCRFNDCRHAAEPGCAVRAAVASGQVRRWRYESYLRLL
jgi:ribosome biogenesis GTPase